MEHIALSRKWKTNTTTITNEFIDTYLPKVGGEYIKVCIMLLRLIQSDITPSIKELADRLDMTERAVSRALSYWEKEGVLETNAQTTETKTSPEIKPELEEELEAEPEPEPEPKSTLEESQTNVPEKSLLTPDALRKKQGDPDFSHLIYVAEMYLGHPMTPPELNSLSYIYDDLKLSVPLIEYLIEYCVSNHKKSMRYIETVALDWHKRGITTLQQAKSLPSKFGKDYFSIMKAMGLNSSPAPVQIEFMERWLYQDGHTINLVLEACRRTITAIGKPSFPYADKILTAWKKADVKSVNEVVAYDEKKKNLQIIQNTAPKRTTISQNSMSKIHNFEERTYDFDELEERYIQKINES